MKTIRKPFAVAIGAVAFVVLAGVAGAATPVPASGPSVSGLATPICGRGMGMMGDGYGPMMGRGHGMGMMSGVGFTARLDATKAELGIRADQEEAWTLYVKALEDARASMAAFQNGGWPAADASPADRQAAMLQMRQHRQDAWQTVASAGQTLMAALDDTQKAKAQQSLFGFGACRQGGSGMMGCAGVANP